MFRTLAAALLVATIASAYAQTAQLPPAQQIQRQQPTLPVPQLQIGTYVYTARTAATVRRSGAVTASGINWACQGTSCTVTGPWPQPGVGACAALAREVGRITSYGRQGAVLNAAQLAQCNVSLTSPPPPPPPPPPPAPPPPPPPPPSPPPPPPPPAASGVRITTSELSVVGGAETAVAVAPTASITTSELSVVGGADGGAPELPGPRAITTPELSVVGGP